MDLIFLIKSIMNKKLFSWKALAGLALLVAMGLTSCKQGTEVDPTDPYNTTKPVQPGVVTGSADLTLQLAVPSDFASLWTSSVKDDVKKALAKKDEIKVVVKSSNMKLAENATQATNTITLPDFFDGKSDKIVNLVFDGSFAETKSGLFINSSALAGDVVNVTLPGNNEDAAYNLTYAAGTSAVVLDASADAYIAKLAVTGPAGKKSLTVGNGINVARIPESSGDVQVNGGYIAAVENDNATAVVNAGNNGTNANSGVDNTINGQKIYGVWASNDVTVNALGYKKGLDEVIIAKGVTAEIDGWGWTNSSHNDAAYVSSVVGLGDNSDLTKPANLSVLNLGNFWSLDNTQSVSNVVVRSNWGAMGVGSDIFENVVFDCFANLYNNSMDNVTFNGGVTAYFWSKEGQWSFDKVNFTAASWLNANYNLTQAILDANDEQAYVQTYWYYDLDKNDGTWIEVDNLSDVPKANKELDKNGATITSYQVAADGNLLNNTRNAHYWYAYVDMLEEDIPAEDFNLVINFTDCKVDGKAMTAKSLATILAVDPIVKVRIGEILYQWKQKADTSWVLISTKG